jgi:hypothetical protein
MKTMKIRILLTALFAVAGIQAQPQYFKVTDLPEHPRLLLLKGEEQKIKDNIASDTIWRKLHYSIMSNSDEMLSQPDLERVLTGRRLSVLSAIERIPTLSYAYRMSGDIKYLKKAEKDMLAVAGFSDWNPSHFLDVVVITKSLAIGYDWLYNDLPETSREKIKNAILSKALDVSLGSDQMWWHKVRDNNWGQVCNSGVALGALAIWEDIPNIAENIVSQSIEGMKIQMEMYSPDGVYPEGSTYWSFGTTYNVLLIDAVEKIFGYNFGLTKSSDFLKTAAFLEHMTGPIQLTFNYSDNGQNSLINVAAFWFASKLNDPSVLWNEKINLEKTAHFSNHFYALMTWGRNIRFNNIPAPEKLVWTGGGLTPVALMRTSWTNPNAIYVGFKGGKGGNNHGHLDVGSFVMDANGVRWASDLSSDDYHNLEVNGVDLWNLSQTGQRWQMFRYNNFCHNTLTVNNELHHVDGYAGMRVTSDTPARMEAESDLSEVFEGQLAGCVRQIAIVNQKQVEIRDKVETLNKETLVSWRMLTASEAKITGKNSMELRQNGKKLKLIVEKPAKVVMRTWTTVPSNDFESRNPGTVIVGFEVQLPAESTTELYVKLIPQ